MLQFLTFSLATIPTILVMGFTSIQIESYRHEYNPAIVKWMTLQLVNFTDHLGVNGSMMLAQDMDELMVTYAASVPQSGGKTWNFLKNRTSSMCELLGSDSRRSLNIISVVMAILKSSSHNFPSKCPLKKDREISFFDLHLDAGKYPLRLPEMKFNGIFTMHSKNVFMYTACMAVLGYYEILVYDCFCADFPVLKLV